MNKKSNNLSVDVEKIHFGTGAVPSVQLPKNFIKITPQKILLCQLRQIGDVLLATASVEMLAKRFPSAEIHFFAEKKCSQLLENNPHIHKIWQVDKKKLSTIFHEIFFYKKVAKEGFDLVIDFQQLPRCKWVVGMSNAPVKLTTDVRWYNKILYTHSTSPQAGYAGAFKAQILLPLDIEWNFEQPKLVLTEEEQKKASSTLAQINDKPFINLDISHRHVTRKWPAYHYASLIDGIAEAYPEMHFFLSYGPGEDEDVKEVKRLSKYKEKIIIPDRLISLREMAACMKKSTLHIGNCSSPRHIAVALNIPSFTILGSTSTGWTFPSEKHVHIFSGINCQPCNRNSCDLDLACLKKLTATMVLPYALDHISKHYSSKHILQ